MNLSLLQVSRSQVAWGVAALVLAIFVRSWLYDGNEGAANSQLAAIAKLACNGTDDLSACHAALVGATAQPGHSAAGSLPSNAQQGTGWSMWMMLDGWVLILLVAACVGVATWAAMGGIDHAPPWVLAVLARLLHMDVSLMSAQHLTPSKILWYKVDHWFSSHPLSKLLLLLVLTVSLITLGGLSLFAASDHSIYDATWAAVAGAGLNWSFWDGAGDHLMVRVVSLLISVGGMLITALLLGIVSDALGQKVDEMRRGRSAVLECGHTLVLGWSEKIFCLLDEMCQGNELAGGRPIVVLSEVDKEVMEEEIFARHNFPLRGSTIICRKGDPMSADDLRKVSVEHAGAIVILADTYQGRDPDQSDARTLRTVLCLARMGISGTSGPGPAGGPRGCILAEMCHADHEALLHTLAGGPHLRTVVSREVVGRLMVQCARYPALTHVLKEMLGFEGNEFYIDATYTSSLVGRQFGTLQQLFPHAVPMGLRQAGGAMLLNPPPETQVEEGDALVLLAEDESHLAPELPTAGTSRTTSLFRSWSLRGASTHNLRELVLKAANSMKDKERDMEGAQVPIHEEGGEGTDVTAVLSSTAISTSTDTASVSGTPGPGGVTGSGGTVVTSSQANAVGSGGGGAADALRATPVFARVARTSPATSPVTSDGGNAAGTGVGAGFGMRCSPAGSDAGMVAGGGPEWAGPSLSSGVGPGSHRISGGLERGGSSIQERVPSMRHPYDSPGPESSAGGVQDAAAARAAAWLGGPQSAPVPDLDLRAGSGRPSTARGATGEGAASKAARISDEGGGPLSSLKASGRAGSGSGQLPGGTSRVGGTQVRRGYSRGLDSAGPPAARGLAGQGSGGMNVMGSVVTGGGVAFGGRFLFCGWRQDIVALIRVLDEFCTVDSELWLLSDVPLEARPALLMQGGLDVSDGGEGLVGDLQRLRLVWDDPRTCGSLLTKRQLQLLYPLQFTAILILAEEGVGASKAANGQPRNVSDTDSRSLATLLLLRQIQVEDLRSGRLEPPAPVTPPGMGPLAGLGAMGGMGAPGPFTSMEPPSMGGVPGSLHHLYSGGLGSHVAGSLHHQGSFTGGGYGPGSNNPYAAAAALVTGSLHGSECAGPTGHSGPPAGHMPGTAHSALPAGLVSSMRSSSGRVGDGAARAPSPLAAQGIAEESGLEGGSSGALNLLDRAIESVAAGGKAPSGVGLPPTMVNTAFREVGLVGSPGVASVPAVGPNGELGPADDAEEGEGERVTIGNALARAPHVRRGAWQSVVMGAAALVGSSATSASAPATQAVTPPAATPTTSAPVSGPLFAPTLAPQMPQAPMFGRGSMIEAGGMQGSVLGSPIGCGTGGGGNDTNALLQSLMVARASSGPNLSHLRGGIGVVRASQVPTRHGRGTPGLAVSGSDDDEDDEDDDSDWQSSDSDDPIGLLRKQRKAAASDNGVTAVRANGVSGPVGPGGRDEASGDVQGSVASGSCGGAPPTGGLLSSSHSKRSGLPSGPRTPVVSVPPSRTVSGRGAPGGPAAGVLTERTSMDVNNVVAPGGHAGVSGTAAGEHEGNAAPKSRWSISTGNIDGVGQRAVSAAAAGPMRSLRGVVNATLAARRVAGTARARRASFTGDPMQAGGAGGKAAGGGAGLLTAMTNLGALGGGKKARKGRKGGAVKSEWLQELQQAVQHTVIVSELLDGKTYEMVRELHIAQYVLSNELVSQLLALVAACPERADIFDELFQPGGNELYTRPARWLLAKDESISYFEAAARASNEGEVLLGYIARGSGATLLNPPSKNQRTMSRATVEALVTIAWS